MELHDTDGDLVGEGKASTSKYNEEKGQEEILTNAVKKSTICMAGYGKTSLFRQRIRDYVTFSQIGKW